MLYPPIIQQFTNSLESSYSALQTAVVDVETTAHPKGGALPGQGAPSIVGLGTLGHHVLKGIPRSWCAMMYHDVMMSWFQGFTMNMLRWFQGFANNIFGQSMDFCKLKPEKRICDGANHGFRWTFSLQQIEWNNQKSGEHVTFNKSMTPTIRKQTDRAGVENCSGSVPKKGVTTSLFNGGSSCHGYFRGYERFHIKLLYNHQVLGHTGWMRNHVDMGNAPGMWWHVHDNCDIEQYVFARVCPQSMSITETSGLGTFRHINKIK